MVNVKKVRLGTNERYSFSKINEVLEMPNLIEVQKSSYRWFVEQGLKEVFDEMQPIRDYSNNLELTFLGYRFDEQPKYTILECKERDATYAAPLRVTARLLNKALQLLRADGAEIISRVEPGQLDHAAVQPRGETVFDGVADNAEMLHAGYSSIVNCASALRARSCRPQRRAPRGRRASCR